MLKFCAAIAATAAVFAASSASALTLTFAVHVTSSSPDAPPVDDFEVTYNFDPVYNAGGGLETYYGELSEFIDTPQGADMLAVAGITPPLGPNYGFGVLFGSGSNYPSVNLLQNIMRGDNETETLSTYSMQIFGIDFVPAVKFTPGGLVYLLQEFGDLSWEQRARKTVGYLDPVLVDERYYQGVARLVRASVEAENPAIPEPHTWALMILGFGVVGGAMRARRALAA